MIKSYIAVRVFVMLDIVGITLYTIALVNGWPIIHTLTYPSAIVWCALSLPLAALFVWSVYHRLSLVQNKHKHEQFIIQQRDLMQLEAERQNLLSLPYQTTIQQENSSLVNGPVAQPVHMSRLDMSTKLDALPTQMSSAVQFKDGETNEIEAPVYTPTERAIYGNERQKSEHKPHYTDDQIGKRLGVSAKTIQRTRNAMKQAGKL